MTEQQLIIRLSAALSESNSILAMLESELRKQATTLDRRKVLAQLQSTILDNEKLIKEAASE